LPKRFHKSTPGRPDLRAEAVQLILHALEVDHVDLFSALSTFFDHFFGVSVFPRKLAQ
jgi:hypothetical protein